MEFIRKNLPGFVMLAVTFFFLGINYVLGQSQNENAAVFSAVLGWIFLAAAGCYILWLAGETMEKFKKNK